MTSSNNNHGGDRQNERASADPAYSVAKAGTMDSGFSGAPTGGLASSFSESVAMSPGPAQNWWGWGCAASAASSSVSSPY